MLPARRYKFIEFDVYAYVVILGTKCCLRRGHCYGERDLHVTNYSSGVR